MNLSMKEGPELKPKDYFKILLIGFILISTWIASSQTLPIRKTDSTTVSYYRLGEFAKFVDYKFASDSIILNLKRELRALDSVSSIQDERLTNYEFVIMPTLKSQLALSLKEIEATEKLGSIKEEAAAAEISRQKGKKWSWGATGLSIGAVVGLLIAALLGG